MIFIIILMAISLLLTPASDAISIPHGEPAPAFTMTSVEGKALSLSDYKEKIVVMIFWRTEQKRSLLTLEDAKSALEDYGKKGVLVLSVIEDSDNREEALKILEDKKITYPLLIDNDRQVYGSYGVRVFPTTVIINKEGIVVYDIPSHPLTYKTKLKGYIRKTLGEIDESKLEEVLSPHKEIKDEAELESSRLYNLALKFTDSGLHDMAINTAVKSVEAKPDMIKSHILLGFLYLEIKEEDKALEAFNKAIELDPHSNDAKTGLGGALILKGDIDKAIEVLDSAATANPYPQMTYYELGRAYELKGDKDKSIVMYKKAIEKIVKKQVLPSSISLCK